MNLGGLQNFVTVLAGLVAVVALFASWRFTRNGVTMTVYRDTALAWQSKSEALEAEVADLRHALAVRDTKIAALEGKVSLMADTLTGRQSWQVLEDRTAQMLEAAGRVEGLLGVLARRITGGQP